MNNEHHHHMDRELVSGQPHELKYLAQTHGASVEEVEEVIRQVGGRSRRLIEQELDKRFHHRSRVDKGTHGSSQSERGGERPGPAERGTGAMGAPERPLSDGQPSNDDRKAR